MKILAVITARGGSKRIPRKNIKEFCGKPIIAYSIEAALGCSAFDEVMVSTDDEEIAEISRKYGANVPFFRSAETSNDYANSADVMREVILKYEEMGKKFDVACCIYPTAPFITTTRLEEGAKLIETPEIDSVQPMVPYSYPPQRAFVIRDGNVEYNQPEYKLSRSQDLEPMYHDAGQYYFFKIKPFIETNSKALKFGRCLPLILSEAEVQDIDTADDWVMAELKYKIIHGQK